MIRCPYGQCTMVNLCKGNHCVRKALDDAGWIKGEDGQLTKKEVK
jgi:hypothetical protein